MLIFSHHSRESQPDAYHATHLGKLLERDSTFNIYSSRQLMNIMVRNEVSPIIVFTEIRFACKYLVEGSLASSSKPVLFRIMPKLRRYVETRSHCDVYHLTCVSVFPLACRCSDKEVEKNPVAKYMALSLSIYLTDIINKVMIITNVHV